MDDDLAESGKKWCQPTPKPRSHVFYGGILQAFDVIEIRMIQHVHERIHGPADLRVIVDPADLIVDYALDANLNLEAVPVHALAFVVARKCGQGLGGFKTEVFGQAAFHGSCFLVLRCWLSRFELKEFLNQERRAKNHANHATHSLGVKVTAAMETPFQARRLLAGGTVAELSLQPKSENLLTNFLLGRGLYFVYDHPRKND